MFSSYDDNLVIAARFYNGAIAVYPDRVEINRKGIMPMFFQGYSRGIKVIPIGSITAIEFKKQGLNQGFMHFSVSGEGKIAKRYKDIVKDENTVTFTPSDQKKALQVKEAVEKAMNQYKQDQNASIIVDNGSVQKSPADELLKFKQLLDSGVITKEEFEKAKKTLLG